MSQSDSVVYRSAIYFCLDIREDPRETVFGTMPGVVMQGQGRKQRLDYWDNQTDWRFAIASEKAEDCHGILETQLSSELPRGIRLPSPLGSSVTDRAKKNPAAVVAIMDGIKNSKKCQIVQLSQEEFEYHSRPTWEFCSSYRPTVHYTTVDRWGDKYFRALPMVERVTEGAPGTHAVPYYTLLEQLQAATLQDEQRALKYSWHKARQGSTAIDRRSLSNKVSRQSRIKDLLRKDNLSDCNTKFLEKEEFDQIEAWQQEAQQLNERHTSDNAGAQTSQYGPSVHPDTEGATGSEPPAPPYSSLE